jgi:divalent metal cation (Fe/Co/Zn/Cd) transporter
MFVPALAINFSITQVPVALSLVRNLYLAYLSQRIRKKTTSKLVQSYFLNYRVASLYDIGVLLSVSVAAFIVRSGNHILPSYFDATVSLSVSVYALIMGIRMTTENFKNLIDLPLGEDEQLRILNVLAAHYDRFETVGNIYTRQSGSDRFIEIELYLRGDTSVTEVDALRAEMRQMLEDKFGPVKFNILPLLWDKSVPK